MVCVCVCACVRVCVYLAPDRVAEYCADRVCQSVSLSVLSVRDYISGIEEIHVRSSPFLCMLPMAVARSSYSGVAICYVLPVLRMT